MNSIAGAERILAGCQEGREGARRRDRARAVGAGRQRLGVALVEAREGFAEAIGGEDLRAKPAPPVVDLEQRELVELRVPERGQVGFGQSLHRNEMAVERQRVAERHEDLLPEREALGLQGRAPRRAHLAPAVAEAARMMDDLESLMEVLLECVAVARSECRSEAFETPGRDVRARRAAGDALRVGARDENFEARDRLGLAIRVEPLGACEAAVGVGREEHEEGPLVGAASEALGTGVHAADEQRARLEREDFGRGHDDVGGDLVQRAHVLEERGRAAQRPRAQWPVVDRHEVRREHRRHAIERVWRRHHDAQRSRRRRGAAPLRALGQQLGVARVETRDGIAEMIGSEDLRAAAEPGFIDLEELERFVLVRADVVAATGRAARTGAAAE